jgi:hypothetical protein
MRLPSHHTPRASLSTTVPSASLISVAPETHFSASQHLDFQLYSSCRPLATSETNLADHPAHLCAPRATDYESVLALLLGYSCAVALFPPNSSATESSFGLPSSYTIPSHHSPAASIYKTAFPLWKPPSIAVSGQRIHLSPSLAVFDVSRTQTALLQLAQNDSGIFSSTTSIY